MSNTHSRIDKKKIAAYELLVRINKLLVETQGLRQELAKVEAEIAKLEKGDGGS